jgi:hypothetical protein
VSLAGSIIPRSVFPIKSNEWREVAWEEVTHARYNSPYPAANGLIIAEIRA